MFSLFYLYIVRNDDNKDDQSIKSFEAWFLASNGRGPGVGLDIPVGFVTKRVG